MVRSYARYELEQVFGLIASAQGNSIYIADSRPKSGGLAIVPALERVIIWDVKKGEKVSSWFERECKAEVTCLARNSVQDELYAVGYNDGSIRLWRLDSDSPVVTLNGHRSAITALTFDASGTRLASGSRDTNVVLWDVVAETGLTRLKGHKDQITGLQFIDVDGQNHIISCSKDTYVKVWDLTTSHCIETHTAHRGECWAMDLSIRLSLLVTAGTEGELKLWSISAKGELDGKILTPIGTLHRHSRARPSTIMFDPSSEFLVTQNADKSAEIYRFRTKDEQAKRLKRRKKRAEAKSKEDPNTIVVDDVGERLDDLITSYTIIRTEAKIKSVSWLQAEATHAQLLFVFANNAISTHSIPPFDPTSAKDVMIESTEQSSLEVPGHQSDIRDMCLNSIGDVLATASDGGIKLWNIISGTCIRTMDSGYVLCISFLLDNQYLVAGTKEGDICLYQVAGSTLVETIKAHDAAIWSLQMHPDGRSLVTGSADKSVKFWRLDSVQVDVIGTTRKAQQLTLKQVKTLKLTDDVLSVRFTPDAKLLAVALLDATVKLFFADTLKFFLSLYGHKLPVLNMDISSDSKLLATCSADKNVKLWGLDFGDCHKSIFAHNDAILQVKFESEGHNFFTTSRDKMLKYWDGDRFENILRLDGHHAEVSALAVSRDSEFVITSGHDKSIRVWRQVDDPVFLEEERERELEEIYENDLAESLQREDRRINEDEEVQATRPGQQTTETLAAGEKILEALTIAKEDRDLMLLYEEERARRPGLTAPPRNPVLALAGNISAEQHLLNVCIKIKASHLEDALIVLPFDKVVIFFSFLDLWAQNEWSMPLTTRIMVILVRIHHAQMITNHVMRPMLEQVRNHLRAGLQRQKDLLGFNMAALTFVKREWTLGNQKDFTESDPEVGLKKRAFTTL